MSTTNILDLNNRIDTLEKAVSGGDSAQANKADIATEFSTTTSYTVGNFVYYGGKLYQFNADHSAGAWDPTDVVESNVTDQIVSNASAIAGLSASDVAYDNTDSGLTATDVQGALDELNGMNNQYEIIATASTTTPTDISAVAWSEYRFVTLMVGNQGGYGICTLPTCILGLTEGKCHFFKASAFGLSGQYVAAGTVYLSTGELSTTSADYPVTLYGIK